MEHICVVYIMKNKIHMKLFASIFIFWSLSRKIIIRLGTGFTDKFLEESTIEMQKYTVDEKPANYIVSKRVKPDVWLRSDKV